MRPCLLLPLLVAAPAAAQLRVATWNVSNYSSGRAAQFQVAIYTQFQGRSLAPDLLVGQEFLSATAVANFLAILNSAPGGPGDWAAAPFINGNDTDNAFFYRTAKVQFIAATVVAQGSSSPTGHPRDVVRYDIRPIGYSAAATVLACYSSHMKSGSTSADQTQRLAEGTAIRANAGALPAAWNYLLAGDFNIQNSGQAAYQQLVGAAPGPGRFFDPISTPGNWNNNGAFRFVHTQAPGGTDPQQTGGMDDRFDFILLSAGLADGVGFDYIGNPQMPYSTTTWNDPNHSLRVWGNDGSSFDNVMTIATNTMVGAAIAQAIHDSPGSDPAGGHLPVFLDLRVPPEVSAPAAIDFGQIVQNSPAQADLTVANGGNVSLWTTAGIASLTYTLAPSPGFTAPPGSFAAAPGTPGNTHLIAMTTATPGPVSGTITINSNAPDEPARIVLVSGTVIPPPCYANCDGSSGPPILSVNDFICFQNRFAAGDPYANCDGSTVPPVLNVNDFICFINVFGAGCR